MNKLSIQDRVQILNCLSEGVGINATGRMWVFRTTVTGDSGGS